jgi:hypothetical protein
MRTRLVAALTIAALVMTPGSASAWGIEVHKFIMSRAISLLPREIRPYFEKYQSSIVEHAGDPDLWRNVGWLEESPRHFVDMDAYGPYPFKEFPHDYDEAVRRYGLDFVQKNGTLPWRAEEMYRKLVEAFAQKAAYSRENVRLFSSVVAHYTADAHQPFHAALNYDGQLTGQWGIHSRFETELFERYRSKLHLVSGVRSAVPNPREFIIRALTDSFALVQPILDADKAAVAGREFYDDGYFDRFFAATRPTLEKRLSDSITAVASMISAAWVEAGQPAVPVDVAREPRPVRRR